MECVNPNTPEFKKVLEDVGGNPLLAEIEINKSFNDIEKVSNMIVNKLGVDRIFDENPELANAVYEALGFGQESYTHVVLDESGDVQEVYRGTLIGAEKYIQKNDPNQYATRIVTKQESDKYLKEQYPEIDNDIKNETLIENWEDIINNSKFKKLYEYIKPFIKNNIKVYEAELNSQGRYTNGNVYINKYAKISKAQILLHELIHSITLDSLKNNESKYYKEISDLYNKYIRPLTKTSAYGEVTGDFYGVKNIFEFVAEAFTNREFQEKLNTIIIDRNVSVWKKLLDIFMDLLGIPVNKGSLLSEVINITDNYLNSNQITPEQKQQAQQIYSQYLDTIFPDSKVKDIVYHGGSKTFEQFIIDSENRASGTSQIKKGIYFSKSKNVAKDYVQSKEGITSNALNIILNNIEKSLGLREYEIFGSKEEGYTYEEEQYKKPSEIINKLEKIYGKLNKNNLYFFSEEGLSDYSYMNQLKDFENLNIDSLIDAMRTDNIKKIKNIILEYNTTNKDTSKLYSVLVNLKNPTIISNRETVPIYNALINKESLINKAESVIVENVDDSVKGNMREPSDTIIVFEPEQIHILSSKADIQGFKDFMSFENSEFSKHGTYQQFRDFVTSKSSIEIENRLIETGKIDRVC